MESNWAAINGLQEPRIQIDKAVAYHLAGQAVAICLGNRQKQLPDVHFQIHIDQPMPDKPGSGLSTDKVGGYTALVEGGRLIHHLPLILAEALQGLPNQQQQDEYKRAFEADIINLLVGPLAEAKFVANRDGKAFNANLVNIVGLSCSDGKPDSSLIVDYMDCFLFDQKDYDRMKELFMEAYGFVNNPSNWFAISSLAGYIQDKPAACIDCEEVVSLMESRLAA
jgi:hypothetical protein